MVEKMKAAEIIMKVMYTAKSRKEKGKLDDRTAMYEHFKYFDNMKMKIFGES
jgi:hypothetical protein